MSKKYFIFTLFLFVFLTFSSIANGATYYISPGGDDASNGLSQDTPIKTIQKAVDVAQPGDTIMLSAGEYRQDIISRRDGSLSLPITITGSLEAILKGGGNPRVIEINHDYHILKGFTVDGLHGSSKSASGYRDKLIFVQGKEKLSGVVGFKTTNMTIQNAGGECVRLRYFVTKAEIAYNTIKNCGKFDFVFNNDGKNGEGIYVGTSSNQWNDGKNPTNDPDETRDNHIHHNNINTQGNECVDIKEGATANIVEYNTCTGQKDPDSAGLDSRGDGNIFRYNSVKGSTGAGIRFGGWLVKNVQYGKNNDAYGNTIENNKGGGIKFEVSPQGKVCDNQFLGNPGGNSIGTYALKFNPENSCIVGATPIVPSIPTITPSNPPIVVSSTNSLANSDTLVAHSNNFSDEYEPKMLWDECYEGTSYDPTACTTGGRDTPSFWLEFDLKKLYTISKARLYGDAEGTWISKSWAMSYKNNINDNWITVFSEENALFNDWSTRSLNITARYIKIEVSGNKEYSPGRTQARELEIYGVETIVSKDNAPTNSQPQVSYAPTNSQPQISYSSSNQTLMEQLEARILELKNQILAIKSKLSVGYAQEKKESCVFLHSLSIGLKGENVKCLQKFLNLAGFPVSLTGLGSLNNETSYFGLLTKQAVIAWQNANALAVLTPLNLISGTGYWGLSSISHYKKIMLNLNSF